MGDEREMIELLVDSWKMVINVYQMMTDNDGLYRWCSQCGANMDMDCIVIE